MPRDEDVDDTRHSRSNKRYVGDVDEGAARKADEQSTHNGHLDSKHGNLLILISLSVPALHLNIRREIIVLGDGIGLIRCWRWHLNQEVEMPGEARRGRVFLPQGGDR